MVFMSKKPNDIKKKYEVERECAAVVSCFLQKLLLKTLTFGGSVVIYAK